jgi:predicted  nucleic acid-binding Zn-ribbon protein
LLEVQAIDTKIDQAAHRRAHLASAAQLAEYQHQLEAASEVTATAQAELGDVRRELARSEAEVEKVRARRERDQAHLDAGAGQAKELVALQHEVHTLNRRLGELEDAELEIMERVETAEGWLNTARAVAEELTVRIAGAQAEVDAAHLEIDAEVADLQGERGSIVQGLDARLVALYEKLRASRGGIGAAALRARQCEGCRLMLNAADLERIRSARPDEVVQCEECGRILVRLEDSGL